MTFADLLAIIISTYRGSSSGLNDNGIQFILPLFQCNFIGEGQFHSFGIRDFREARMVAPILLMPL